MIYLNHMLCLYLWETDSLLKKRVIVKGHHNRGEFISLIFVRNTFDGGFRLIVNLKKLNGDFFVKKLILKMRIIAYQFWNSIKN